MGGGLMQLVAYGAQDVYLTGNPQITFFKVVYRRHTNFSIETIEHTLSSTPDFGRKSSVTVTRNGDLATRMYLKVVVNAISLSAGKAAYVCRLGHALIKTVELEIGGSKIDKQYGNWMDIWYELSHSQGQESGYDSMVGNVASMTTMASSLPEYTMYVPLQFWFNRNTGLALPLIALQYHEVRVHLEFAAAADCVRRSTSAAGYTPSIKDASLLVDYIYLDSEERRRFAQVGHEYLIEQLQFTGEESVNTVSKKSSLGFNHPTKEIVWACQLGRYSGGTFGAESADDLAKEIVAGKFDVTAVAGATYNEAGTDEQHFSSNITVDNDLTTPGNLNFIQTANLGGLYGDIVSATVRAHDAGVDVLSVVHNITVVEASQLLSEMTDNRAATGASALGSGVVVNQPCNFGLYIDGSGNTVNEALIQLNGHDRFDTQGGAYFNTVQPFQHHSNTPADGINVYSFALNPEQHQPSGTANLSRIDNTQLSVWFVDESTAGINYLAGNNKLYVFALSNNVLRVMSGMGGLAYSN